MIDLVHSPRRHTETASDRRPLHASADGDIDAQHAFPGHLLSHDVVREKVLPASSLRDQLPGTRLFFTLKISLRF
jgi:hypothetical protein